MDIEVLRTFQRVADWKSIYKAADELFVSQSTVNSRIRVFEDEVGCELFVKHGRGIKLSENGQAMLPYVDRTLALLTEGAERIQSEKRKSDNLSVAAVTAVASYLLPERLMIFRERFRDVEINVTVSSTPAILEWVLTGKTEIGLVRGPFQHKGVEAVTIHRDPLVAIASSDHRLAGRVSVKACELQQESVLAFERKTSMWSAVADWFKQNGLSPRIAMEVDHIETTKQMAVQHQVIAFVPLITVQNEIAEGKLWRIPIEPPLEIYRDTVVIRHRRKSLSAQGSSFWQQLTGE